MTAVVLRKVVGKFEDFDAFKRALGSLQVSGVPDYEAYGPVNLDELGPLMPARMIPRSFKETVVEILTGRNVSPVRGVATVGAITGLCLFFYMAVATSNIYKLIVGGKPPVSRVPYVVIAYEGTILLGAIAAFVATLYYARLIFGRQAMPEYDPRFSGDLFGVGASCAPEQVESTMELLRNAGAVEVYEY